jgi:cytochrome P450
MPIAASSLQGPKPRWLTGNLSDFRADRLAFFTHCAKNYGDIVPIRLRRFPILLLNRPDLIEDVLVTQSRNFIKHVRLRMYKPLLGNGLVTAEGDHWRRHRKLSAPAFQASRIEAHSQVMVASTERMLDSWQSDQVRDVHADTSTLAMEIICHTLFGAESCPNPKVVGQAIVDAVESLARKWSRLIPLPQWMPTPANTMFRQARRSIDDIVAEIVNHKRAGTNRDGTDLLSALLSAQDEDGSAYTDDQLLDEVRTLFLAGHETTALALTYSLHLLSTDPKTQETLHSELDRVLDGKPPSYGDLERLSYTRKVVTESMRLYPPAYFLGREAIADCKVGGIAVPKGMNLFMSQWVMHRDERYFRDPLKFDPDRWTEGFEKSLPRFVYFPFGAGPRYCIGQTFATTETILVLATICQRFTFGVDSTFRLELSPGLTLRPRSGLRLTVQERAAAFAGPGDVRTAK